MSEPQTVRVGDLLRDIDAASARMALTNPHRLLLVKCGVGLIELATRIGQLETAPDSEAAHV